MNPRCVTLGYDRNGKPHSSFPFEVVEIVNRISNLSSLLERASLSEIDADIWELNQIITYERKEASNHWNQLIHRVTEAQHTKG